VKSILEEAAEHVEGRRQLDYGPPSENFYRVAQLWTAYLDGRGLIDLNKTDGVTPTDYALMQALVKIARLEHGYHHDSVVDLAGYAACAAQINEASIHPAETVASTRLSTDDDSDYDEGRGRDPELETCYADDEDGLLCTLDIEHTGDHEVHAGARGLLKTWPQVNEPGNETPSDSETPGLECGSGATVKGQDVYCSVGAGHTGKHAMYNAAWTLILAQRANNG